jgi:pyridoxal phosphate enzyme (YggS family)
MSTLQQDVQANLRAVIDRIEAAAHAVSRDPAAVTLVAVSKAVGPDAVLAAVRAGQRHFGENYVQEAVDKIARVREMAPASRPVWHFIGPIQSNKTRPIAEHFDWVESVDRLKVAERLAAQRPGGLPPLNVLLQVNISGEPTKSGVAPDAAIALAREVCRLPRLRLRGLMAIPEPAQDPARQRAAFARVRALFEALRAELGAPNASVPAIGTLSMGMSDDLEAAIAEGATEVRIGTAIFGPRTLARVGQRRVGR